MIACGDIGGVDDTGAVVIKLRSEVACRYRYALLLRPMARQALRFSLPDSKRSPRRGTGCRDAERRIDRAGTGADGGADANRRRRLSRCRSSTWHHQSGSLTCHGYPCRTGELRRHQRGTEAHSLVVDSGGATVAELDTPLDPGDSTVPTVAQVPVTMSGTVPWRWRSREQGTETTLTVVP